MTDKSHAQKGIPFLVIVLAGFLLFWSCAEHKQTQKEDPFMEKWRTTADNAKGYSPAPKQRTIALEEETAAEKTGPSEGEPQGPSLPTRLITLKMYNTEVTVLLRALARAAGQDIILNDGIEGRINIDVKKAPWDQVFLGILSAQSLSYEWNGDIIRIVTAEDNDNSLKRLETEEKIKTKKREIELVDPLLTRVIKVDYSDAVKLKANLEKFLTEKEAGKPLGSVMVDEHTNSLIIQAIYEDLAKMIPIIQELDRPTPQILIEAHIVEAGKTTGRELGVRWGGLYHDPNANYWIAPDASGGVGIQPGVSGQVVDPASGFMVNFPTPSSLAGQGLTLGIIAEEIGGSILALELQAFQEEGKLNILSSPSITTLDNQKATIESGKEVPYQTVEDKEVKVEYKKAVLSLEVTPHVIEGTTLKLKIFTKKDELDFANAVNGQPAINTKKAETNVIVFDGQTTVIGGLKKEDTSSLDTGVPGLKDIPLLGWLFKGQEKSEDMEELLIFITPHILKVKQTP